MPDFDPNMEITNVTDARRFLNQLRYSFTVHPQSLNLGGSCTLTWNVESVGNQDVWVVVRGLNALQRALTASATDSPTTNTTYVLEAYLRWFSPPPGRFAPPNASAQEVISSRCLSTASVCVSTSGCRNSLITIEALQTAISGLVVGLNLKAPASVETSPGRLRVRFTIVMPIGVSYIGFDDPTIDVDIYLRVAKVEEREVLWSVLHVSATPHCDPPDIPLLPDELEPWHWVLEWFAEMLENAMRTDVRPAAEAISATVNEMIARNVALIPSNMAIRRVSSRREGVYIIYCPRVIVFDPRIRETSIDLSSIS